MRHREEPRLSHPVPGKLDQLALIRQQLQAAGQTGFTGRTMKNTIILTSSIIWMDKIDIQGGGQRGS
jgi:hypothetical protein